MRVAVSGRLKDGDGKVVRDFERETFDLVVDGRPSGTYGFTLR
jgi:hypothetical protein